jgi:hypothetical protein
MCPKYDIFKKTSENQKENITLLSRPIHLMNVSSQKNQVFNNLFLGFFKLWAVNQTHLNVTVPNQSIRTQLKSILLNKRFVSALDHS